MAEAVTAPRLAAAPDPGPDPDGKDGGDRLGRVIDIAGICAAVVLGVIIFDVISGGKVTRLLRRRKPGCEDCGQEAPGDG